MNWNEYTLSVQLGAYQENDKDLYLIDKNKKEYDDLLSNTRKALVNPESDFEPRIKLSSKDNLFLIEFPFANSINEDFLDILKMVTDRLQDCFIDFLVSVYGKKRTMFHVIDLALSDCNNERSTWLPQLEKRNYKRIIKQVERLKAS